MNKDIRKGIGLLIISTFSFAMMNTLASKAGSLPFFQKVLFRNSFSLVAAVVSLWGSQSTLRVPKESRWPLIARCLFGTIGVFCNYYAIDRILLANANTLSKLSPFYAIVFSALILKEKASRKQVYCILLALVGSLFIIVPSMNQVFGVASLIAMTGGLASGTIPVALRLLKKRNQISSATIVFYFSAFSTVLAVILCAIHGWEPMTLQQVLLLLGAGACCAVAQFAMTGAYRYAAPTEISVYDCSQIVFAALLGFIFFGQIPSTLNFIAYILIIIASLLLFIVQKKESRKE